MKTNIKMEVNPEQSQKVQEICFENGIGWCDSGKNILHTKSKFLSIRGTSLFFSNDLEYFKKSQGEEVDADLFIRTNGSCEETCCTKEDLELEKKIQNLYIALNKKVKKNKNQALEISLLLKQKEELKDVWKSNYDEIKKQKEDEKILLLRIDGKSESIEILANKIVSNAIEFKQELKEKDIIIKYLENRLNEKYYN